MSLELARTVADAVLYEGYLLYPYRSTSSKNQVRWQFGVLSPAGSAAAGIGEESSMSSQYLLRPGPDAAVSVYVRCLQLQVRSVERRDADGGFTQVGELEVDGTSWISWDEAVERELDCGSFRTAELTEGVTVPLELEGGDDAETLPDAAGTVAGRIVRRRYALAGTLRLTVDRDGDLLRLSADIENTTPPVQSTNEAIRRSFIGAHLLLSAHDAQFVSVIDPPDDAKEAVERCSQHRCWPVLAGPVGQTDVMLGLPIILYDHPEVAPESAGALFDSTEIDEILTLRVMTLTDEEKAQARATDAHAAAIIDRCEQMTPEQLQGLHGILRDPHAGAAAVTEADWATQGVDDVVFDELHELRDPNPDSSTLTGDDWWAAEAAGDVSPETDAITVRGTRVARGSLVKLHPNRRADAQDLFFADQTARVSAVHVDLDGETHVAVTLVDDPAAEMHDWYGRYLYFAPDELEPLAVAGELDQREENPS
jgi:hypothetical protein